MSSSAELLAHAHAHLIAIRRDNGMKLMLSTESPEAIDDSFDLRQGDVLQPDRRCLRHPDAWRAIG
jgi:hypothetical protein